MHIVRKGSSSYSNNNSTYSYLHTFGTTIKKKNRIKNVGYRTTVLNIIFRSNISYKNSYSDITNIILHNNISMKLNV